MSDKNLEAWELFKALEEGHDVVEIGGGSAKIMRGDLTRSEWTWSKEVLTYPHQWKIRRKKEIIAGKVQISESDNLRDFMFDLQKMYFEMEQAGAAEPIRFRGFHDDDGVIEITFTGDKI